MDSKAVTTHALFKYAGLRVRESPYPDGTSSERGVVTFTRTIRRK